MSLSTSDLPQEPRDVRLRYDPKTATVTIKVPGVTDLSLGEDGARLLAFAILDLIPKG